MTGLTSVSELLASEDYIATRDWLNERRAAAGLPQIEFIPRALGCREPWEVALPQLQSIMAPAPRENRGAFPPAYARIRSLRGVEFWPLPDPISRFVHGYRQGLYDHLLPTPGVPCDAEAHHPSCAASVTFRLRVGV